MAKNDRVLLDAIIDDRVAEALPSTERDEAFEYLAFEQVMKDCDLSRSELENGSIDGRQDGGLDGVFVLVNGHVLDDPELFPWPRAGSELHVVLITCKHHDSFKQATLDNVAATLAELFDFSIEDGALKGAYSPDVLNFRSNFLFAYRKLSARMSKFSIRACYVSRGDTSKLGEEVRARADQIVAIIRDSFGTCNCSFDFVGSEELIALHRKVPSYSLELPFVEALTKGERYVVLAKLSDYRAFVSDEGKLRRYLFDSNVRDFMGLNRVNDDIRNTLNDADSPDFWWLNNGVTILATSARIIGKAIQIQDIQIVNGLQTTESVFRYFQSGGMDEKERCVLVKVIVTEDVAVRDSIIRATNNQTVVEVASLHATDKVQRDIEEILFRNGFYYERRTNHYVNQGYSPADVVAPLYLASAFVSLVLKSPHRAAKFRQRFMKVQEAYDQIFSDRTPLEIWPKLVAILKRTDSFLDTVARVEGSPKIVVRSWRHVLSFFQVAKIVRKFDFTLEDILSVDGASVSDDALRVTWEEIRNVGVPVDRVATHNHIMRICEELAKVHGIAGTLRGRFHASRGKQKVQLQVSQEFVEVVRRALPAQPWKPGTHKRVMEQLRCSYSQLAAAIEALVADGQIYAQRDGVLYDQDGNVVGFDAERVDAETMQLRESAESDGG